MTTPNRLAREKSPYLLQHAHNPVDWYPYGEEAFARARAEDRPIFLSIGYSTCHWCHVMERESFEDPATAALMNGSFVNIKVDREERPDVDQVYMQAVMAMTGQGGWPLNVWLTPDLKPFYGGTYFPPDGRWGRPGFREVLGGLARTWEERRDHIDQNVEKLMEALARGKDTESVSGDGGAPSADGLAAAAVKDLERAFDATWGGFGSAPKFPRPSTLAFLTHRVARGKAPAGGRMLERTLEMMRRGGMYDHVGGGFSRYSTDDRWLVPHFEKMLYDNALLVEAYLDGHLLSGREDFARVARDVLAFVGREMTHPEGGFYSAQDADSEGVEGKFYVFDPTELEEALAADAPAAMRMFGVTPTGNFEGKSILWWPKSPAEVAAAEGLDESEILQRYEDVRRRLYAFRERRIRPGLDDKIITSWNGLMIAAYARAGCVLAEPAYVAAATRAAEFVETHLRAEDGTLLRRWREGESRYEASLDDHTYYAHGLLALFSATGEPRWLARCVELLSEIEDRYGDPEAPAYYFAKESPDIIVRMKESYDGALPSGNSMQALLLARLGALLDREDWRSRAEQTALAFASHLVRIPEGYPQMLVSLADAQEPPRTLFIVGDGAHVDFRNLVLRAHCDLMPGRVVIPVPDEHRDALLGLGVPLEGKRAPEGGAAAFLCEDAACRAWDA